MKGFEYVGLKPIFHHNAIPFALPLPTCWYLKTFADPMRPPIYLTWDNHLFTCLFVVTPSLFTQHSNSWMLILKSSYHWSDDQLCHVTGYGRSAVACQVSGRIIKQLYSCPNSVSKHDTKCSTSMSSILTLALLNNDSLNGNYPFIFVRMKLE